MQLQKPMLNGKIVGILAPKSLNLYNKLDNSYLNAHKGPF